MPALVANEIDFTVGAINSLLPHIRSGKLRALAVASTKRTAFLPDVPTIAEAAPAPGYGMDVWAGFLAPKGTPKDIIARLNVEISRILRERGAVEPRRPRPQGDRVPPRLSPRVEALLAASGAGSLAGAAEVALTGTEPPAEAAVRLAAAIMERAQTDPALAARLDMARRQIVEDRA